jgi:hypothetical protein
MKVTTSSIRFLYLMAKTRTVFILNITSMILIIYL